MTKFTTGQQDERADRPSRSARKRNALALQKIGEQLVRLSRKQLDVLEIPDDLRTAVNMVREIKSREARRRQMQFIGRLMQKVELDPILKALAAANIRVPKLSEDD